jgi:hypothetical protein
VELDWLEALADGGSFGRTELERHPAALPVLSALLGDGSLEWQGAATGPDSSKKP